MYRRAFHGLEPCVRLGTGLIVSGPPQEGLRRALPARRTFSAARDRPIWRIKKGRCAAFRWLARAVSNRRPLPCQGSNKQKISI